MAADLLAALILAAPEDRPALLARIRERASDDDHPYGATRTAASGRSHLSASDARTQANRARENAALRTKIAGSDLLDKEEARRRVMRKGGEFADLAGKERSEYVTGAKRLILFHATEAQRIAEKYGWKGKNPHAVQLSLFGDIGMHAEPSGTLWDDFSKWYAHQETVTTLGAQVHVLGAIA